MPLIEAAPWHPTWEIAPDKALFQPVESRLRRVEETFIREVTGTLGCQIQEFFAHQGPKLQSR